MISECQTTDQIRQNYVVSFLLPLINFDLEPLERLIEADIPNIPVGDVAGYNYPSTSIIADTLNHR